MVKMVEPPYCHRLNEAIGHENAEMLVSLLLRMIERAIDRRTMQSLEIIINEKGFVRHFNGSDNVSGVKPAYIPE